jgi:hypothetical protein
MPLPQPVAVDTWVLIAIATRRAMWLSMEKEIGEELQADILLKMFALTNVPIAGTPLSTPLINATIGGAREATCESFPLCSLDESVEWDM